MATTSGLSRRRRSGAVGRKRAHGQRSIGAGAGMRGRGCDIVPWGPVSHQYVNKAISYKALCEAAIAYSDNTAINLGLYNCTTMPLDYRNCATITDYSGFTYDKNNHQMLQFGGGHAATLRDDVNVFDFSSLTWAWDAPRRWMAPWRHCFWIGSYASWRLAW